MANRLGAFLDGLNLILRGNGGRIIAETFFEQLMLKKHRGYAGSHLSYVSNALLTADTTTTPILQIPVPSGDSIHGIALIGGKQDNQSDASSALVLFAGTNAAGTTAVKGTQNIVIIESDAGTNVTATADDTNDLLNVNVVGPGTENWLWTAHGFYMLINTAT